MRDEYDSRFWNDHHEGFADGLDRAGSAIRLAMSRLAYWDGSSHQLLALVAAFALTALTFNTTTA